MLACAIASLALLRAPPLRADGQRVARSAIHMATSAEPKKASAFGTFMASKSMKMTTIKKGAKPKLRGTMLIRTSQSFRTVRIGGTGQLAPGAPHTVRTLSLYRGTTGAASGYHRP